MAEQIGDLDRALSAYENALRHNPHSLPGLTQVAGIARIRENYVKVRVISRLFFRFCPIILALFCASFSGIFDRGFCVWRVRCCHPIRSDLDPELLSMGSFLIRLC